MKNMKYSTISVILVSLIFSIFTACSHEVNNQNNTEKQKTGTGTATVKMYVPDYYAMADMDARAIAPQTEYAKLSYLDDETNEWTAVNKIALKDAEKSEISPEEETEFPGYIYTFHFDKVYAQTYAAGALKIELLDSSEKVITSGTSTEAVIIESGEKGSATFYTVPQELYQNDSYLNKGQMKFYKYTFKAGSKYFIYNNVNDGNDYPDLVFFNNNGTLDKYYAVDSEDDSIIEITPYASDTTKIIGIWSDDDTYISRYIINIYPELLGIEFSENSIDICKDETYQVTVKTIPEGAYLGDVTYSSSNDLVSVDGKGVVSTASTDEELITTTITAVYEDFTAAMTVNFAKGTNLLGTLSGDDLHWTKAGSPYRIKGDILVTEGSTLVIDPGVTVRFTDSYDITVRGEIQARGTAAEPIMFTGKNGSSNVQWNGISVSGSSLVTENTFTYKSGNIIEYCNFDYAGTPLSIDSGTYVNYCNFNNCTSYICVNENGRDSVFINNELNNGIELCSGIILENNNIHNYFYSYSWFHGIPVVKNNSFYDCNVYPRSCYSYDSASAIFSYNTFDNSVIYLQNYPYNLHTIFTNNNFDDRDGYIVQIDCSYTSDSSYDFANNYWGAKNTIELDKVGNLADTPFIYDYFDDSDRSRVDYSNWLTKPVEKCGYLGDAFIGFDVSLSAVTGTNPDSYSPYIVVNTNITYTNNTITQIRYAGSAEAIKTADWQEYTSEYQYSIDLSEVVTAQIPVYVQVKDNKGNESPVVNQSIYCRGDKYLSYDFNIKSSEGEMTRIDSYNPNIDIETSIDYVYGGFKYIRVGTESNDLSGLEWNDYSDTYEYKIDLSNVVEQYVDVYVQYKTNSGLESEVTNKSIYCRGDKYLDFTFKVNDSSAEGYNFKETSNPVMTIAVEPGYHVYDISKYRFAQIEYTGAMGTPDIDAVEWKDYTDTFEFTVDETNLENGYAYIAVQLQDINGSESSLMTRLIPFGAPVIYCSNDSNLNFTDDDETVYYSFTAKDGGNIKKYQLYVDTALMQSNSGNLGTTRSVSQSLGLKYMSAGSHTITLKVWDAAKNVGIKEVPFTISHADAVDTSTLAGTAWDNVTGQPLKDERTTYLWHLDSGGTEVDDTNAAIGGYTNAIGGFGGGCASRIYTDDTISLDVSTNAFTIEYWIKSSSDTPYLYINKRGSFYTCGDYGYLYCLDEDENVCSKEFRTDCPAADTEWHYVAKIFNGSYFATYIDGVLTNYTEDMNIKLNNNDSKLYMNLEYADAVDEIRISNAARSADEISAYYNAVKTILDDSYGTLSGVIY